MPHHDSWHQLLEVYFATKRVYAISEETDEELMTNLQPLNEFRAALDHIMRSMVVEHPTIVADLSNEELPGDFAEKNLQSATSHMYRAFFDACDSVSINYRESIRAGLEGFSKEVIATALPDYYSEMRPRIDEINRAIASMRVDKGQNPAKKMQDIDSYTDALEELAGYLKRVNSAQSSLLDLKKEEDSRAKTAHREGMLFYVVIPVICLVAGAVIEKLFL